MERACEKKMSFDKLLNFTYKLISLLIFLLSGVCLIAGFFNLHEDKFGWWSPEFHMGLIALLFVYINWRLDKLEEKK